jgi:predicted phosphohydrolase
MQKIRLISDTHLEFYNYPVHDHVSYGELHENSFLPILENEKEQILILAGDIVTARRAKEFYRFFKNISNRFKHVFYIRGNHESYRFDWNKSAAELREAVKEFDNITVMDNDMIIYDDIAFIGTTLWTDFKANGVGMEFHSLLAVQNGLNDYRCIWHGNKDTIKAIQTQKQHKKDLKFIKKSLIEANEKGLKSVVISHHAPSKGSSHERFTGELTNAGFYSDLDKFISKHNPTLWVHGHTHDSFDYMIDKTRVVCNPMGYGFRASQGYGENREFNKECVIEI